MNPDWLPRCPDCDTRAPDLSPDEQADWHENHECAASAAA
jgi:hypothetical protein